MLVDARQGTAAMHTSHRPPDTACTNADCQRLQGLCRVFQKLGWAVPHQVYRCCRPCSTWESITELCEASEESLCEVGVATAGCAAD